ncbi:MAG TPA: bifunctional (p)ppGpp synthetase/guanosine-3',5'-bis(diphosphate) 3'-pyrophosphohydrolase [Arcobacter sp.]|nr:bifunctional (p)ppGpp synthetase/guanosine-3',5'-bis(diphosphate) 3'-pyrophosphohydrolase [Arcobacter sp.]
MEKYLHEIKKINTIESAVDFLSKYITISASIQECINFCIEAHKDQTRKSGEPYVVHPILVAAIAAYNSSDESMVLASLLHDVVEDTEYSLSFIEKNYGLDVAKIVDGLTKITEIRESEFDYNHGNKQLIKTAMTFRKILIASIDDVRVLIIKLFDRMHNMLTLDSLKADKQHRISEETLLVYAPIAHRLGMSALKNALEDLSFSYIYPQEYNKIDEYIKSHQVQMEASMSKFVNELKIVLGLQHNDNTTIYYRVKHYYSIYLKMQRKGINIDEVLDLYALRVITKNDLDCYHTLGKIHTSFRPLISRFKDYIAIPKENGYQTIHTTVFHNTKIFEIQIRTEDMHKVAEYGVAAHWKYKSGARNLKEPNLKWLHTLEIDNEDIEEFYDETKKELFSEEVIVYSPRGDIFRMPRGSTAYDFAFLIHTDLGYKAIDCLINTIRKPLLTELKSGDIISINVHNKITPRCSWFNIVKTNKARKAIRNLCQSRQKQVDELNGRNIINTIFIKHKENILNLYPQKTVSKVVYNIDHLKNIKKIIQNRLKKDQGLLARLSGSSIKLKEYSLDNMVFYSNTPITSTSMDHCCHPKLNDDIIGFKNGKDVEIHHKMCENAYIMMQENRPMVFTKWSDDKFYVYKTVVSLQNKRGELARLLTHLALHDESTILFIEYGKDRHSDIQYCTIDFEIKNANSDKVKKTIEQKAKIIEFYSGTDAYK